MPEVVSSAGAVWVWVYWLPLLVRRKGGLVGGEDGGAAAVSAWTVYGVLAAMAAAGALLCWAAPGGPAWGKLKLQGRRGLTLRGPRGLPVLGSLWEMGGLAHRRLADLAASYNAKSLMAFSLGSTRVVIASQPGTARELLNSSSFADRPLKQSAGELLFGRAIGFAPFGDYWRRLRRIAATHLFAPRRIQAYEPVRQKEIDRMFRGILEESDMAGGSVAIRAHLQNASLNNIMGSVFGRTYDFQSSKDQEAQQLQDMVREGFELLGAFNWSDHLPALQSVAVDPHGIVQRCKALVPKVRALVQSIIDEHREQRALQPRDASVGDFVDVLLDLEGDEKLSDEDMIAVLWEMIFRGTDTTAILTEWILAEIVLNPEVQRKIHEELDAVAGTARVVVDADMPKLPYLQAVIKETLRVHPPGPLLSWARLATHDVCLAGHHIPAGTTAMVNMWAITHDSSIWSEPSKFQPDRFLPSAGGQDIDIRGNDLRLAPFGAGRRVCPGRALGLATVQLWVARLLQQFEWSPSEQHPVDLSEVLKLSCEMVNPLIAHPRQRLTHVLQSS